MALGRFIGGWSVVAALAGCSASPSVVDAPCSGADCTGELGGNRNVGGGTVIDGDTGYGPSFPPNWNPLCGYVCNAMSADACVTTTKGIGGAGAVEPPAGFGSGGTASDGPIADAPSEGGGGSDGGGGFGGGGASAVGGGGEGGRAPSSGGSAPATGGASEPHPPGGSVTVGCRIELSDDDDGFEAACAEMGDRGDGSPCHSSADCAPTFACVVDDDESVCRPYCCTGEVDCAGSRVCADRALAGGDTADGHRVPVCTRAESCRLDDPWPCDDPELCVCTGELVCAVLDSTGATGCTVPGVGVAGDACPCAPGFVCSPGAKTCLEVCDALATDADQCGGGRCQWSAFLPEGMGTCTLTDG